MFTLHNLKHAYDGAEVLRVDAWQVGQGEHWLLLGPSGSGKSTLLHILAAILRPTSGAVTVAGQDLAALRPAALDRFRGRHIGIVLQRLHLVASLTVLQNVQLAQYLCGAPRDAQRALEVLQELGLEHKGGSYPSALSFGQAQRVAVARAVVNRPGLLLADEPTSNLDDGNCRQTMDLLEEQARACGATLVIATHDQRIRARVPNQYVIGTVA